jgi:GDPmannose 4,6-dehydratase
MWKILQQDKPEDFVIATGVTTTVREFTQKSFKCIGINLNFNGNGKYEIGVDEETGDVLVRVHPDYFRPAEVDLLLGNPEKALQKLEWDTSKTSLDSLINEMVEHDIKQILKN